MYLEKVFVWIFFSLLKVRTLWDGLAHTLFRVFYYNYKVFYLRKIMKRITRNGWQKLKKQSQKPTNSNVRYVNMEGDFLVGLNSLNKKMKWTLLKSSMMKKLFSKKN